MSSATKGWLLLIVLSWSQFAFAAHQFEHSPAEVAETCAICLQFDRDDDVTIDAAQCQALPVRAAVTGTDSRCAELSTERFSLYRSRASP